MRSIGNLPQTNCGRSAGKEIKMVITGIIVIGVIAYAIWAIRKIRRSRKNGSCCSGSCSGCVGKKYCSK
ncbi:MULTISPECIES: FeoB-associated Cys-rich membrane protein [Lachnospiraceae]|nr:FeoB-associated Cys-rich membrane protein [Agathobacter rectalis]